MTGSMILTQATNFLLVVLVIASPFLLVSWFSRREEERKMRLDRLEAKLDQIIDKQPESRDSNREYR